MSLFVYRIEESHNSLHDNFLQRDMKFGHDFVRHGLSIEK